MHHFNLAAPANGWKQFSMIIQYCQEASSQSSVDALHERTESLY